MTPQSTMSGILFGSMPAALMRFDFPVALPCYVCVLGARLPVRLPNLPKSELCLPVEAKHGIGPFDGAYKPPPLHGISRFNKVNEHHSDDDWTGWGFTHAGGERDEDWRGLLYSAVLRVSAVEINDDALREVALAVNESLYDWYLLFRDWLETLTHVDLGHEHSVRNVRGRSEVETAWWVSSEPEDDERGYALVNPPVRIKMAPTPHVRRQGLERAAREANLGKRPPEPHLLLRDARSAHRRSMYRRCILDAAIAVELVVSDIANRLLDQKLGRPAREALLSRDPITRKIKVVRGLGVPLPPALEPMFTTRNRVVHEGHQPSATEVERAIEAATAVVVEHVPL